MAQTSTKKKESSAKEAKLVSEQVASKEKKSALKSTVKKAESKIDQKKTTPSKVARKMVSTAIIEASDNAESEKEPLKKTALKKTITKSSVSTKIKVQSIIENPIEEFENTLFQTPEISNDSNLDIKDAINLVHSIQIENNLANILQEDLTPAPTYEIPEAPLENIPKARFESLVANESILLALRNAGYTTPNEYLQSILPAMLRGHNVCVLKPEHEDGFLAGAITAAQRLVIDAIQKGKNLEPAVLLLLPTQQQAEDFLIRTKNIFQTIDVTFAILPDIEAHDDAFKKVLNTPIDILFATPKSLKIAEQKYELKKTNLGFCLAYSAQNLLTDHYEIMSDLFQEIYPETTQKVLISHKNTPKIREFSYKYLEECDYFSFLSHPIRERQPRQFAHVLTATQKFQVLLGHLKTHKPQLAVVFANTRTVAEWIAYKLHGNDIKVELITQNLSLNKKKSIIKSIQENESTTLVTTDFYSKSLGFEGLNCLYHFDIPDSIERYLDRMSRIEDSKNPLAVSFICEDYGFNMGKIEEEIGFKIYIAIPDKNYFNLKDKSDYPLDTDGRVKRIGIVYSDPVTTTVAIASSQTSIKPSPIQDEPVVSTIQPSVVTSPIVTPTDVTVPQYIPKAKSHSASVKEPLQQQRTSFTPQDQRYTRRDERARDVLEQAKIASQKAQQEKKVKESQITPSTLQKERKSNKRPTLFAVAVHLVQDAFQSAAYAAMESVSTNVQQNMPRLSSLLNKYSLLKKSNKDKDD